MNDFKEKLGEIIADEMSNFMIALCEQKGHDKECHICQLSNELWKKHYRSFLSQINSFLRKVIEKDEKTRSRDVVFQNWLNARNGLRHELKQKLGL